ncbi:MAG: HEAT repeat domain-containing protein, partial [Chloroflexi bacterium]|nr:HEAT repeat domain-containing protein [Chloroflexota bacterium]
PVQARPELESQAGWVDSMDLVPGDRWQEKLEITLSAATLMDQLELAGDAKPVEILDLLHRPRVVVLGDPGCGKSTFLRHVAYAVACGESGSVGEAALERLPIFVRIVQFSQARTKDSVLTFDTYIREVCEPKWASLFQHALDTGEALMLLDGLDEVVDAHLRQEVAEAIQRLVADYPSNFFVVTSRVVGYQAARLSGDFAHYTIQPLPLERIAGFVKKWYAAIEREAGEVGLSEEVRERAEELSRTIQERPGIRRLAENPLLLTIIALVNWRGRKLPNRRVELYAHAAETLIESWPYRRQGVELDTERVIRLLSPVAYRIFATRSSGDIAEDDLLPILVGAICRVDGVDEREAKIYAIDFLAQISERSGIFRERGYDERGRRVFGFLHLTFAEYFTARYLAGLWEGLGEDAGARRAFLRKYAHVPRWHEVVLLMAGDVGQRDNDSAERATRLIGDILTLDSDYEDRLHRDLLLAGECLADDLRVQHEAARYVLDGLLKLVGGPAQRDAIQNIFGSVCETAYGQFVLEGLLVQLENGDKRTQWGAAWALGEFGEGQAVEKLLELAEDEDTWERTRATWALGEVGGARAVKGLLARLEDEEWLVRANAARALGKIGDLHSQVMDALRALLEDDDRWVRVSAAAALGRLGDVGAKEAMLEMAEPSDAQTMESLLVRLEDQDWQVRWSAAQALGELGDPQAVDGLLARLGDETEKMWVRWSAAWGLGRAGDVRAVEPLLACLEDKDWRLRGSAVRALGKFGDVRAVEPLLARVEDKHRHVRSGAVKTLGELGDVRAVEPLLARLEDEDWQAWERAYTALLAILDRNAPEPGVEEVACKPGAVSGPWDV